MKKFRLLNPDEIECRVSRVTEKGVALLLYKTARTDADLLDETVGPENWQNDFKVIDGVLYGGIGVRFPGQNDFIWKWDAGTESNTEAEKGRASDAYKRSGFKFGLGRELYSAPFIWIPSTKCKIDNEKGRLVCRDAFDVAEIQYDKKERISRLVITVKGSVVFEWGAPKTQSKPTTQSKPDETAQWPICEKCHKPIYDSTKRNGEPWFAEDIAAYTKGMFGKSLCVDCATEEKKKK